MLTGVDSPSSQQSGGIARFSRADVAADGIKIAFYTDRDDLVPSCSPCNREIYWMNPDGSEQTNLTNDPAVDYDPACSPDGSQLTFISNRSGDYELWTLDLTAASSLVSASSAAMTTEVLDTSTSSVAYTATQVAHDGSSKGSPDWGAAPGAGCTISGTAGNDSLTGTPGDDVICGTGGDDTIIGGAGNDTIIGGARADRLRDGAGADRLLGSIGRDILDARDRVAGNDVMIGGPGQDICQGETYDLLQTCP